MEAATHTRLFRRPSVFAILLVLAAIVIAAIGFSVTARDQPRALIGTDLGGDAAPDFTLTNQFGNQVSLAEHRGTLVVLTFLYTHCPDICPLTAARLRQVYEQLGSDAANVSFLAVSVDPERDTTEAAYAFSERFEMLDRWSYLVGTREELEPVWKAYYIGVLPDPNQHDLVMHTAPIYLIDRDGLRQVLHTTGGETDAIIGEVVHDIQILLDES